MNSKVIIVLVLLVVLGGGWYMMQGKTSVAPASEMTKETENTGTPVVGVNSVEIKDFAYSPATLTVKVGDTVTWTNKDIAGHSATADDKSFDTGVLSQGESGSFTFTKAGTFTYFCTPHPNIKGTIIVQ